MSSIYFLGQLYGLEKFWAFLKYYKNSSKLPVEDKLKEFLSNFKSIEDFRVVQVIIKYGDSSKKKKKKKKKSKRDTFSTIIIHCFSLIFW
jgi:RNase P/RNase MRP subunit p30